MTNTQARRDEFRRHYSAELAHNPAPLARLGKLADARRLTLVFGARDKRHN